MRTNPGNSNTTNLEKITKPKQRRLNKGNFHPPSETNSTAWKLPNGCYPKIKTAQPTTFPKQMRNVVSFMHPNQRNREAHLSKD
jgi:hypothetical protein